jgi:glycolate oxidase FAD binding subunit
VARIEASIREISALVGADRIRAPSPAEAPVCEAVVEPAGAEEIGELVRKCESDRIPIVPIGAGRTLANLRTTRVMFGVSLARMARVVAYEPDDMTLVVEAGITLGALNGHMRAHRQRLPVDPAVPALTSIGAMIGAAKAGPLRLSEGLLRDLLIGVRFVGCGGRIARAGGRVVKNVAGYDLMKVLTGSFGTLGIVTEAAFKVRPIPELYALALAPYDRVADAFVAASKLHDSLPLAHLEVLSTQPAGAFGHPGKFVIIAGISGNLPEIDYQRTRISEMLGPQATEMLEGSRAASTYECLRDFELPGGVLAAQLAVLPADLARCLAESGVEFRASAGCGIAQIWAPVGGPHVLSALVGRWREMAASARGHLRVLSVPAASREGIQIFDRPNGGALKLMRRLKETFDPTGIFNPGCFVV